MRELLDAVREAVDARVWGAAVRLAREGAVRGVSDDGEEVCLHVKDRRGTPNEVYLWPDDPDWGCDCQLPGDACVHVAAAVISLNKSRSAGEALPEPQGEYQVSLRYDLTARGSSLSAARVVVWPDGRTEPLDGSLADSNLLASSHDVHAESLLVTLPAGPLGADELRRLLGLLGPEAAATLDGEPVRIGREPEVFQVRVTDDGDDFRLALYRPPGLARLFRGAALRDGVLSPTSHGSLRHEQRQLLVQGMTYPPRAVHRLVSEILPRLREQVPVVVDTARLPSDAQLRPRVMVHLAELSEGLEVRPEIVYGDPVVAVVRHGSLQALGEVLPGRDLGLERSVARRFEERHHLAVGTRNVLSPARAAAFLADELPTFDGAVEGSVSPSRYRVAPQPVRALLDVREAGEGPGAWSLGVQFRSETGEADATEVLRAWRTGRSLVPLMEGGFAPLPVEWLREHGGLLESLLESRDPDGRVDRAATPALVELLEGTAADVPPDLSRLRAFLSGDAGLPEPRVPTGLHAELRPYQLAGIQWLTFLREVELSGILADDMGLGKTLQALAVLLDTPGPHLVVAPTSVLRNWEREAARFTPGMSVNVYHGPGRVLDNAHLTLTSYALLRIDRDLLRAREWGWVVLDEAQAIKNPESQTARAARGLTARHRLALTGTPVENRLDELWSLFHFLMPGLLGSRRSFRDELAQPIAAGDARAAERLRRRVRPYVLRRLKRDVAKDLPPLTEVVLPCPMGDSQRAVYDTVRSTGRLRAIGGKPLQILEALLRMRQAACDPSLVPGVARDDAGSGKLDRLEELLVDIVVDDHKVLVFSQWTSLLDRVEDRLRGLGIDWVRLDGSTRDRVGAVDRFQDPEGPPVFLISLKAGGTGLNLTAADYVVHLDPWWNPAVQQQATDRAWRIGQERPVVSCSLVAEGTVEERILALQEQKRHLADAALGTEAGILQSLTSDELRSLFE